MSFRTDCLLAWLVLGCIVTRSTAFSLKNLCLTSYGTDCCPGWKRDSSYECTVPVCDGDCGSDGHCVGPNLCFCPDGVVQYSCSGLDRPGDVGRPTHCPQPCQNGGQCRSDGRCDCPAAYSGTYCQFATCPSFCSGHGQCLPSGVCTCEHGFSGAACDVIDKAPCYSGVSPVGMCTGKLSPVYLSREECCNSFGKAWGAECQPCRQSGCGFGRVTLGRTCVKLNFCDIPGICGGDICVPESETDITCFCSSGLTYNAVERRCERQQNFCDSNLGVCGVGGSCVNDGPTSHRCECFAGYDLRSDGKFCTERAPDPCASVANPCDGHGTCVSEGSGSYRCRCDVGYEATRNGRGCLRQTYCSVNPKACGQGGECVPVDEFYYCRCQPGYHPTVSGLDCLAGDAPTTTTTPPPSLGDVCARQRSCPAEAGECLPITGEEFICACRAGYRQSEDIRSCEPAPLADAPGGLPTHRPPPQPSAQTTKPPPSRMYCDERPSTCANGRCVSLSSTDFYCSCASGYHQADDRRSCLSERSTSEINPCLVFDICRNGACLNLGSGAFQCLCYRNFELSADRQNCELMAQPYCQRVPTACKPNGTCVSRGSLDFTCECKRGFQLGADRRSCASKNQPRQQPQTPGPPAAAAPTGFPMPTDPLQRLFHKSYCQKFSYVCGRGHCLDLDGSHQYTCACSAGYRLSYDKKFCVKTDLRETGYCADHPDACAGTGHCVNSPGGTQIYQCFCYPGFRNADSSRKRCLPYDYNADTNKVVIHGLGSSGDRTSSGSSGSSGSSDSTGSGYAHLGSPDRGSSPDVSSSGGRPGPPPFRIDGSLTVIGGSGGGGGPSKRREEDGDYATLGGGSGACAILERSPAADGGDASAGRSGGLCQHGWCMERGRDFECGCGMGFRQAPDRKSCVDIDECQAAGGDLCLMGRCVNTIGSYTCECRPGFRLDTRNKLCRDRDECSENPGICPHGECVNLWGAHECRCGPGYRPSNASRLACVRQSSSGVPSFEIDASVSVHHAECPDCLGGCRLDRQHMCRCSSHQVLLGGLVCAPLKSKLVATDAAKGQIELRLLEGVSPNAISSARRSVRLYGCSVVTGPTLSSPWYSLVQCSFTAARR